jgi:hypothetical protein
VEAEKLRRHDQADLRLRLLESSDIKSRKEEVKVGVTDGKLSVACLGRLITVTANVY